MGQVWSSADFDGIRELQHQGGCGSALAVTAQNMGPTNAPFKNVEPINQMPARVSLDATADGNCRDTADTVRGFLSMHTGGSFFVYGDGSVHFLEQNIEPEIYISLSTIAGGEVVQ